MSSTALPFSIQRTVVIAPHPDDDVLAAGGLMQRILAMGGDLHVAFITDGENNPWPQRFMERKWFLGPHDRASWGSMRRREALCSLAQLGLGERSAIFLAFPDQGIAALARGGDLRLGDALGKVITAIQPTLIVSPSSFDLHSDHRAIAYYVHNAAPDTAIITYVVHVRGPARRLAWRIELTERERTRKREAIKCHASQLALSRHRFLSHVQPTESFYASEFDVVRIESATRARIMSFRQALRVLGWKMSPTCTTRR